MPPHLLLHPVFDKAKASTGGADGKVVHPAAYNRVDELDDPTYRLGVEAPENVLELAQQYGALLELGRIIRSPLAPQASYVTELKAQKPEAVSFCQVNVSTFLFVDIDWSLANSSRSRRFTALSSQSCCL
jgi:hypothetical protein